MVHQIHLERSVKNMLLEIADFTILKKKTEDYLMHEIMVLKDQMESI